MHKSYLEMGVASCFKLKRGAEGLHFVNSFEYRILKRFNKRSKIYK